MFMLQIPGCTRAVIDWFRINISKACQGNIPHNVPPPPPAWTVHTKWVGHQILTPPSAFLSRIKAPSDQDTCSSLLLYRLVLLRTLKQFLTEHERNLVWFSATACWIFCSFWDFFLLIYHNCTKQLSDLLYCSLLSSSNQYGHPPVTFLYCTNKTSETPETVWKAKISRSRNNQTSPPETQQSCHGQNHWDHRVPRSDGRRGTLPQVLQMKCSVSEWEIFSGMKELSLHRALYVFTFRRGH